MTVEEYTPVCRGSRPKTTYTATPKSVLTSLICQEEGSAPAKRRRVVTATELHDKQRVKTELHDMQRAKAGAELNDKQRVETGAKIKDKQRVTTGAEIKDKQRVTTGAELNDKQRVNKVAELNDKQRVKTDDKAVPREHQVLGPTWSEPSVSQRTRTLDALADPLSRKLLFVNTIEEDGVCFEFAATTSNVRCDGTGTPFDFKTGKAMVNTGRKFSPAVQKMFRRTNNCLRSSVDPKDFVSFTVFQNEGPVIIVGCDLEQRLAEVGRIGLLNEYCHTTPIENARLQATRGRYVCFLCKENPAAYITKSAGRLLCQYHAKCSLSHDRDRDDLRLYLPTIVSLNADDRMWLSVLSGPLGSSDTRWHPLASRLDNHKPPNKLGGVWLMLKEASMNSLDSLEHSSVVVRLLQRTITTVGKDQPRHTSEPSASSRAPSPRTPSPEFHG